MFLHAHPGISYSQQAPGLDQWEVEPQEPCEGRSDSDSEAGVLCFLREILNYFSGLDSGVHSPVL